VQTTVVKETATLVAADESSTTTSSSTASDARRGDVDAWGMGAFIAAGVWVVAML
jgi:hypothetical protein